MRSQCQAVNVPDFETWDEYRNGCLTTYRGGYKTDKELEIYRHGINTVFNLLEREFPQPELIFTEIKCSKTASAGPKNP